MPPIKDLAGRTFGKLTAIKRMGSNSHRQSMWLCRCECGNETVVVEGDLINGHTQSCGCLRGVKHEMSKTRLYEIYKGIKRRCCNPSDASYKNYGGRGITICDEWKSNFLNFYYWSMENGYNDNLSIERIDVNGNYCPENCKWIPFKKQMRNKRNNVLLEFNGETKTIAEWAEILNIKYITLYNRLRLWGWSVEKALTTPVK